MVLTNTNSGSFSAQKSSWKNIFLHASETYFTVLNIKNNVSAETFYFLMDSTNSGSKASIFKQDAFINW